MKTSFLSLFLLYGVHSLEAPLDGEDEGVTTLIIITINIITIVVIIIVSMLKFTPRKMDTRNMT